MTICPLCLNKGSFSQMNGQNRTIYFCCDKCKLVFASTSFLPTREEEENRYKQHQNGIEYPGYVQFLNQAIEPALPFLSEEMTGLDYGCGPNPTLSKLLEERNISCGNYDPIFFPDLPEGPFNFIFATECFEHFFFPAKELGQLKQLLKSDGILIIMTDLWTDRNQFSDWYYTSDFTHVTFFHADTFEFIADKFDFEVIYNDKKRVVILRNHSVC